MQSIDTTDTDLKKKKKGGVCLKKKKKVKYQAAY